MYEDGSAALFFTFTHPPPLVPPPKAGGLLSARPDLRILASPLILEGSIPNDHSCFPLMGEVPRRGDRGLQSSPNPLTAVKNTAELPQKGAPRKGGAEKVACAKAPSVGGG